MLRFALLCDDPGNGIKSKHFTLNILLRVCIVVLVHKTVLTNRNLGSTHKVDEVVDPDKDHDGKNQVRNY